MNSKFKSIFKITAFLASIATIAGLYYQLTASKATPPNATTIVQEYHAGDNGNTAMQSNAPQSYRNQFQAPSGNVSSRIQSIRPSSAQVTQINNNTTGTNIAENNGTITINNK